jgi:hypothetical protein
MVTDFLKKWEFWLGIVGVFGTIFAIYSYIATNKVGQVSYEFDTQKVFDPTNLSGFSLITSDKTLVDKPVYATDLVIWNSGDLSLSENSDRVREPIRVTIPNGTIYYHIIAAQNLVDASNYIIEDSADKGSMMIRWKFFDPGQGIRMTLVHSEAGAPSISLTSRFFEASLSPEKYTPRSHSVENRTRILLVVFLVIISGAIIIALRSSIEKALARLAQGRRLPFSKIVLVATKNSFIGFVGALLIFEGVTFLVLDLYDIYTYRVPPV